jgi:hypothetical protein
VGGWFGSVATDFSDFRFWVGLAALIAAGVAMVVVYLGHVRLSRREKEIAWKHTRSRGKLRFVLRQLVVSQLVWLPLLFGAAYDLYKTGSLTGLSRSSRWWYIIAVANGFFSLVWSLASWHRRDKMQLPTNAA